ncbi:MAG TPA: L-threonylcarbamoyladenylate synthase [Chitinophagaceae bacterium]|nr:L-threonylcarbamoyladenylate synthase [Chitinophagaceae bacterium]
MKGSSVQLAAEWLRKGEVVAIPTETVYGLAGNAYNVDAIQKIYDVKNRPLSNPLIVHALNIQQVKSLVKEFYAEAEILAKSFWPGPLTMILPKAAIIPDIVTAGQQTVAVRVPSHPLTLELLSLLEFPLAAPSANKFNYISPVTAEAVSEMLGNEVPYILDGGRCQKGIESTIVSFVEKQIKILRHGAITEEQIESVLQKPMSEQKSSGHLHPGMFKKHYSPKTPLWLMNRNSDFTRLRFQKNIAAICFTENFPSVPVKEKIMLSNSGDLEEAAQHLYSVLYELDKGNFDLIIAEKMPDAGLGKAMNERLIKAAHKHYN